MIAGLLNTHLILYRPETSETTSGSEKVTFSEVATVRAGRSKYAGSTGEEAGELFMDIRATFTLRDAHTIGEHWRVREPGGPLFAVDFIEHNRRKGMITLNCIRVNE